MDYLVEDILNFSLAPMLVLISFRVVFKVIRYVVDYTRDVDSPKEKQPEKPKETVVKTYVINSPVKMEPVSSSRDIPKLCPCCLGVPDNDIRCSYCGVRF